MSSQGIEIRGLRELQGAFRKIDPDLPKNLRLAMKAMAERVVTRAQGKMPHVSGEAASSLKPRATQRGAGIAYPSGGTPWKGVKADYYPWLDFGGATGRGGSIKRRVVKGGRYLYPAIAEARPDLARDAEAAVTNAARGAGFETR